MRYDYFMSAAAVPLFLVLAAGGLNWQVDVVESRLSNRQLLAIDGGHPLIGRHKTYRCSENSVGPGQLAESQCNAATVGEVCIHCHYQFEVMQATSYSSYFTVGDFDPSNCRLFPKSIGTCLSDGAGNYYCGGVVPDQGQPQCGGFYDEAFAQSEG